MWFNFSYKSVERGAKWLKSYATLPSYLLLFYSFNTPPKLAPGDKDHFSVLFHTNHTLKLSAGIWIPPIAIHAGPQLALHSLEMASGMNRTAWQMCLGVMLFCLLPSTQTDIRFPSQYGFSPYNSRPNTECQPPPHFRPAVWNQCKMYMVFSTFFGCMEHILYCFLQYSTLFSRVFCHFRLDITIVTDEKIW
jgi:hypothetical protein